MALENTLVYRVFGACLVQVGTGANSALETLGYTQDGVTMRTREAMSPIMSDVMGPELPAEMQKFGIESFLSVPLVSWNPTVWEKVQKKMGNANTAGLLAPSGTLVHTNGYTCRTALVSAESAEDPYYFPTCILREPYERKVSSKHNPLVVNIYSTAFHLATATTVANTTAWSRTLP